MADNNDDLVVMTHDGDIRLDPHVRQEVGMLLSDKGRYATELVHASPTYEFVDPYEAPVKKGSVFILRHDTPPPEHSSKVMNLVAPTVYKMAFQGQWKVSETLVDKAMQWKYAIAALSAVVFFGVAMLQYYDGRDAAKERRNLEAQQRQATEQVLEEAPPQPTFQGLDNFIVREEAKE